MQTDTRLLKAGEIFFALKGPNFNGNAFASKALEIGAAAVVIDEPVLPENEQVFLVNDALAALQKLANHHRKQFNIPFIAITGSNGKTTTKELIHAALSTTFKTHTTKGNLNNHIGVPLTLLSIPQDAEMAVIEMGANHQKEIESYCAIAEPTHGLITNCGKAHMEGFGGVEGIRKGKGELFQYLANHTGTAFINSDLDYFEEMSKHIRNKIYYGSRRGDFSTTVIQEEPLLVLEVQDQQSGKQKIFSRLVGAYNKPNIEAAICIGKHFGISIDQIRSAIESYTPDNARSQLIERGSNKIILDAYNANPSSMQVALESFARQVNNNKYLFIGAMMELGEDAILEHKLLAEAIQKMGIRNVILVGGDFSAIDHPFRYFADSTSAAEWVKQNPPTNALILIKGSRSTKMEKILEAL
ncbi:MAG: UDP-N-acetylmuramoyl-tripeptide--D-alanyl-D-alanine ligase [bacterium]